MNPSIVKKGSKIWISYELSTNDEIFEVATAEKPFELRIGSGRLFHALEEKFLGLSEGEKFHFQLDPSLAYGEVDPELSFTLSTNKLPSHLSKLEIGDGFEAKGSKGQKLFYRLVQKNNLQVTFDANHPLAGKIIEIEGQIVKIDNSSI